MAGYVHSRDSGAIVDGLTISGSEPLVQVGFTRRLFRGAQAAGLHTALDTSGVLGADADDDDLSHARDALARSGTPAALDAALDAARLLLGTPSPGRVPSDRPEFDYIRVFVSKPRPTL